MWKLKIYEKKHLWCVIYFSHSFWMPELCLPKAYQAIFRCFRYVLSERTRTHEREKLVRMFTNDWNEMMIGWWWWWWWWYIYNGEVSVCMLQKSDPSQLCQGWKVQGVLSFPLFTDTFRKGWKVRSLEFLINSTNSCTIWPSRAPQARHEKCTRDKCTLPMIPPFPVIHPFSESSNPKKVSQN